MRRELVMLAAVLGSASAMPAAAQVPQRFENLQVLPRDIRRDSLVAVMRGFAGALGVRCVYCHVGDDNPTLANIDWQSDDRAPKRMAREMLRMVATLNGTMLDSIRPRGEHSISVGCVTCHHGLPRPVLIQDTLRRVLERQGVDSAIAEYRRLREHHYGRGRLDFGVGALNGLAEELLAAGRYADARPLAVLNGELFPDRWEPAYTLGRVYEGQADTLAAVAQYRAVLQAVPNHGSARDRLNRLLRRPPF